jgi:hypothetical protein
MFLKISKILSAHPSIISIPSDRSKIGRPCTLRVTGGRSFLRRTPLELRDWSFLFLAGRHRQGPSVGSREKASYAGEETGRGFWKIFLSLWANHLKLHGTFILKLWIQTVIAKEFLQSSLLSILVGKRVWFDSYDLILFSGSYFPIIPILNCRSMFDLSSSGQYLPVEPHHRRFSSYKTSVPSIWLMPGLRLDSKGKRW